MEDSVLRLWIELKKSAQGGCSSKHCFEVVDRTDAKHCFEVADGRQCFEVVDRTEEVSSR
ncbi:chlorohydrolase [Streptococcus pneumoniae]|nr:chlorohydrolase [Streptococcus pneumoniae]